MILLTSRKDFLVEIDTGLIRFIFVTLGGKYVSS